jgi:hypothetical protein
MAGRRGLAVKLALYNVRGVDSPHWSECFPKGLQLGIKEPFLKQSADGAITVRVDHAADLVYVTPVCSDCAKATILKKLCAPCRAQFCTNACEVWHRKKKKCLGKKA